MSQPSQPPSEPPHDILAADEFAIGAGDPVLHRDAPRDVLAAEEFPLGAGRPASGMGPAHDVLAAEEFPMPAAVRHEVPPEYSGTAPGRRSTGARPPVLAAALLIGLALVIAGRRRRR